MLITIQVNGAALKNKSIKNLFKMVEADRLDAISVNELMGDHILNSNVLFKKNIEKYYPKISKKNYYLMFSHRFYKSNKKLAETIWNTLSEVRESVAYWDLIDSYITSKDLKNK